MTKVYYTIFHLFALSAIIFIGVDAFYRIAGVKFQQVDGEKIRMQAAVDQKNDYNARLSDFQAIIDRNIFSQSKRSRAESSPPKIETLEPTALNIALMGTIAGDQKFASAIIEDKGKRKQALYKVGDNIQEAVIEKILRGKVILRVGGREEILIMEEPHSSGKNQSLQESGITRPTETARRRPAGVLTRTISVRRSDMQEALADIDNLLTQASVRPHLTNGVADGLAVTGIRAGSIFRKMGLRNGDIVQGVNDKKIASPDDLISLYNDLKSLESGTSLQIKRRGRERTLNYRFRD